MLHRFKLVVSLGVLFILAACAVPSPTIDLAQVHEIEGTIVSFLEIYPPLPIVETADGTQFEVRFVLTAQVFQDGELVTWDDLKGYDKVRITGSVEVVEGEAMPWFIPERITILSRAWQDTLPEIETVQEEEVVEPAETGVTIPEVTVVIPQVPTPLPPSAQDHITYEVSRNMLVLEPATRPQVAPGIAGIVRPVDWNGQRFGGWSQRPDGSYLYHVSLQSPGAYGLRVHLTNMALPEGAVLFVYSLQDGEYVGVEGPFTGRGLWDSGEFWNGSTPGDTAIVEYYDPQATGPGPLPFTISELVHEWPPP